MKSFVVELRRGLGLWMAPLLLAVGIFIGTDQLPTAAVWTYANGAVAAPSSTSRLIAGGVGWTSQRHARIGPVQLPPMSETGRRSATNGPAVPGD